MAITEYGTIGIRPMGTYDPDTKYGLLNLVEFDGSSYVAHTDPPLGSLPTNTAYWQVSAQGTGKATASSVGTVKPDGATTEVNSDGSMSVKTALQDALGLVKGSNGIKVGADGSIDVNTLFTQATEMANIIAGEAIATALGKISKSIAVTMGLDQNALLKNMLTNIDANDSTKINTAAYVHKLTERIGMGDELTIGANLTAGLNALNSDFVGNISYSGTTNVSLVNMVNNKHGVISGLIKSNDAIGAALVGLATLQNYKPAVTTYFVYYLDAVGVSWGYLDMDGVIYFNIPSPISANTHFRVNIPYITA